MKFLYALSKFVSIKSSMSGGTEMQTLSWEIPGDFKAQHSKDGVQGGELSNDIIA